MLVLAIVVPQRILDIGSPSGLSLLSIIKCSGGEELTNLKDPSVSGLIPCLKGQVSPLLGVRHNHVFGYERLNRSPLAQNFPPNLIVDPPFVQIGHIASLEARLTFSTMLSASQASPSRV